MRSIIAFTRINYFNVCGSSLALSLTIFFFNSQPGYVYVLFLVFVGDFFVHWIDVVTRWLWISDLQVC